MEAVLIAEPASPPRAVLMADLRRSGLEVVDAGDLPTAMDQLLSRVFDVVVLDAELGGPEGEVPACLEMIGSEVPVILVSGCATVTDRVRALDAGAVDVVARPYSPLELGARVRARVRFARECNSMRVRAGAVQADLLSRTVTLDGVPVPLSNTEYRLLVHFLQNAGQACSRADIVRAVWGEDARVDGNLVEVYVGYLRRKLSRDDAPLPLVTLRNVGYRLDTGVTAAG